MPWVLLLAQTPVTDPISGGAGWVGTGLLGSVLCWLLLKHLPEMARQNKESQAAYAQTIKDLNEHHERMTAVMNERHERAVAQIREDAKTYLARVIEHCESEMHGLNKLMEKDLADIKQSLAKADGPKSLRNLEALEEQIKELQRKLSHESST